MQNQRNWSDEGFRLMVFGGSLLAAFGVLGWQMYRWLRDGQWPQFSVIDALSYIQSFGIGSWARFPHDWLGLHAALDSIGISGVLLLAAFLASFIPVD